MDKTIEKAKAGVVWFLSGPFFLLMCVGSIGTSVYLHVLCRSLWLDEAMLAWSLLQRNIFELCATQLDNVQTAPVGWLYLCKIVTLIFGTSEISLRLVSFVALAGIMWEAYYIGKNIFHVWYPLAAPAFIGTIAYLVNYSNEFKPYITEGFCVLMVFIAYDWAEKKKISTLQMAIIWSALILFANPVCFFEGAILICWGVRELVRRNWKELKDPLVVGVCILTTFAMHYFLWLRGMANNVVMKDYWKNDGFILIPKNATEFQKMLRQLWLIFIPLGKRFLFLGCILVLVMIWGVYRKNQFVLSAYLGVQIALGASALGMFPIAQRLWLFIYPLTGVVAIVGIQAVLKESGWSKRLRLPCLLFLCAVLFMTKGWMCYYLNQENCYYSREEMNDEYEYLLENAKEDDGIVVSERARYTVQYLNGYGKNTLKRKGNAIEFIVLDSTLGHTLDQFGQAVGYDRCYVMDMHGSGGWTMESARMNQTRGDGEFYLVSYAHETPLYYYIGFTEKRESSDNLSQYRI